MITAEQYFQAKPHTAEQEELAAELLDRVARLCDAVAWDWPICPNTGTSVSGSKGGQGDGGFRLPGATTGAAMSSHKEARAVDVYDPKNELDDLITDPLLMAHGLFREHPDSTPGWCHLTSRPPKSGLRTFMP